MLYCSSYNSNLKCSEGHEHLVRNYTIPSDDEEHLLKEFPGILFKIENVEETIVSEEIIEES